MAVYFWKPGEPYGWLSNWYTTQYALRNTDGTFVCFNCSEQAFMYLKACHFHDSSVALKILLAKHPREQKALGKTVANFSASEWDAVREKYMRAACEGKFRSDPELARRLLETNDAELVEASPYDRVWGIGMYASQARRGLPYRGKNLLGKVLMAIRDDLKHEAGVQKESHRGEAWADAESDSSNDDLDEERE